MATDIPITVLFRTYSAKDEGKSQIEFTVPRAKQQSHSMFREVNAEQIDRTLYDIRVHWWINWSINQSINLLTHWLFNQSINLRTLKAQSTTMTIGERPNESAVNGSLNLCLSFDAKLSLLAVRVVGANGLKKFIDDYNF